MSAFETDPTQLQIARAMDKEQRDIEMYAGIAVLQSQMTEIARRQTEHQEEDRKMHAELGRRLIEHAEEAKEKNKSIDGRLSVLERTESKSRGAIAGISFVLGTGLLGIVWAAIQFLSSGGH